MGDKTKPVVLFVSLFCRADSASHMSYDNPPPYPGPGPTAPYPPYAQQPGAPPGPYPGYPPGPYQPGQPGYQGYPQYGWQNAPPPPPGPVYGDGPKNTGMAEQLQHCAMSTSVCFTGVHADLEGTCSPAPGPDGLGEGGDLFDMGILFAASFCVLFCCSVSHSCLWLLENTAEHPYHRFFRGILMLRLLHRL